MLKITSTKLAQRNIDDFLAGNQPIRPPQPSNTAPSSRPVVAPLPTSPYGGKADDETGPGNNQPRQIDERQQREQRENTAYNTAYYQILQTYPKLMEQMDQILKDTAARRYGPGGVKWQQPQGEQARGPKLQQAVSQFPGAENDPHVRYFVEQNLASKLQGRD